MPDRRSFMKGAAALLGAIITPIFGRRGSAAVPEPSRLRDVPGVFLGSPLELTWLEGKKLRTEDGVEFSVPRGLGRRLASQSPQLMLDPVECLVAANKATDTVWKMVKDSIDNHVRRHGRLPFAIQIPGYVEESLAHVFGRTREELRQDLRTLYGSAVIFDAERFGCCGFPDWVTSRE